MAGNNLEKPTLELHWATKVPSWTDATGPWFLSLRLKFRTLSNDFSFEKIRQIVAGYGANFKHASSLHSITNQTETELQVLVLKSQQLRTAVEGAADGLAPVIPGPSHSAALLCPNNFLSARALTLRTDLYRKIVLKLNQNKKGQKNFQLHRFWILFLSC